MHLLQSGRDEAVPARVEVTKLVDGEATRDRILTAIRNLAGRAKPLDAAIITYSGHGLQSEDYYLVPFDMGLKRALGQINDTDLKAASSTLISDEDLERELLPLNVAHAALILDVCHSGRSRPTQRGSGVR
jgi:hypothetical protein